MKRDALPQHEIDLIVRRLAAGERLEAVQASMPTVTAEWFERNAESLYKLAGLEEPAGETEGAEGELHQEPTPDAAPAETTKRRRGKAKQPTE